MTPPDASSHALNLPGGRGHARARVAPQQANRLAAERLGAVKRRRALLRRRAIVLAITMFLALWTVIFAQLVTGHDPALARSAATKAVTSSTSGTTTSGTTTSGTTTSGTTSSGTTSSGSTTAVQTSQS